MCQNVNLTLESVEGDSFVGFKVDGANVRLYYPKAYHLDKASETLTSDILHFLRTFILTNNYASNLHLSAISKDGTFIFTSYIWIINDYLHNGIYHNREKDYMKNKGGRINWKETIRELPIVSNRNIIYYNLIGERKHQIDNILVDIHKFCVKKCINTLGWLFNLPPLNIKTRKITQNIKKYYLHTIDSELDITFEDTKKARLQHMHNVLEGLDENDDYGTTIVYGINSYHYIFERLIDEVFGNNDIDKTNFYPGAKWHISIGGNTGQTWNASKLRPDTILIRDSNCYIIDAKYYPFGTCGEKGSLPETSSIQKQIVYAEYIDNTRESINAIINNEIGEIFNAFLIPYDRNDNPFNRSGILEYVGHATSDSRDNQKNPKTYDLIHTFLIDLKHLILTWDRHNHDSEDIELLINKIQEYAHLVSPQNQ